MPIAYEPQNINRRFKVPRTLAADFTSFLNHDIPNTVMDFVILKDWYDQFKEDYEEQTVRGEIYPDSTKSRYENTDNALNIRCDVNSGIQKGDMLIQPDGTIFILDWEVALESNNAPSRALRCNMRLTVPRIMPDVVDEDGFLISEGGVRNIVDNLPANAYRYNGRPEFTAISGTPGITPNALTLLTVQYNQQTKLMTIGDQFVWGKETYEIVDLNLVGLNIGQERGTIKIQAKKLAGGINPGG